MGGARAELVVAHRSISGSSDKILCSYTSELQMMQCWERAGGVVEGEFEVVGGGAVPLVACPVTPCQPL